jgi:hypothetical protein
MGLVLPPQLIPETVRVLVIGVDTRFRPVY